MKIWLRNYCILLQHVAHTCMHMCIYVVMCTRVCMYMYICIKYAIYAYVYIEPSLWWPYTPGCGASHWSMMGQLRATSLKKTFFPFPKNYQLFKVPQIRMVGPLSLPRRNVSWFDPVQHSWVQGSFDVQKMLFCSGPPWFLALNNLSLPFPTMVPKPWRWYISICWWAPLLTFILFILISHDKFLYTKEHIKGKY